MDTHPDLIVPLLLVSVWTQRRRRFVFYYAAPSRDNLIFGKMERAPTPPPPPIQPPQLEW